MAVSLDIRPEKTIGTQKSLWSSVNNPIRFTFTATDFLTKTNYFVQISLFEVGSNTLLSKKNYRPFTDGQFIVDISGQLQSYCKPESTFEFNKANHAENFGQIRYYLQWQEFYEGSATSPVTDPIEYTAHNSAQQLGFFDDMDSNAPNLVDYLPVPIEVTEAKKAKFLTRFEKPSYWPAFPFDLSFIYSENIKGYDLRRVEDRKDINGGAINTADDQLFTTEVSRQNRLSISGGYDNTIQEVEIWIELGVAVPDNYVYPGYWQDGYTETL